MARWHLTSNEVLYERACDTCDQAQLVSAGYANSDGFFVRSYAKRAITNINFVSLEDKDWITVAGTLVFGGQLGHGALVEFYKTYLEEGIESARSQALGHYAVAIRHGDSIIACTDDQGTLNLYYAFENRQWVISNSLQVVAEALESVSVDPMGLLSRVLQIDTVGRNTFFPSIKRLFGSEILEIDLRKNEIGVRHMPSRMLQFDNASVKDSNHAVARYVEEVRHVFGGIANIGSIAVNTTGGMDTRTVLAGAKDAGIRPQLLYGIGNSGLTNTQATDLGIARKLAKEFQWPLHEMDWSGDHPFDSQKLYELFRRFGFLYTVLGASDGVIRELEGGIKPYPTIQLGGYCPAFTNMKTWERAATSYSLEDLVEDLTPNAAFLEPNTRRKYHEHICSEVLDALKVSPVDFPAASATLEQFVRARLYLYLRPETRAANFFNEFTYYMAPFICKRLYDYLLTIPLEFRRDDHFQLKVIHSLAPELLDVPVFSGIRPAVVDFNTLTLHREPDMPRRPRRQLLPPWLRSGLKTVLVHSGLWRTVDFCRQYKKGASLDQRIRKDCVDAILSHSLVSKSFHDFDMDIRYLQSLRMMLAGIEELQVGR